MKGAACLGAAVVATVATVAAAAGCGGHVDKAGGPPPAKPVVLTLATHNDDEEAYAPFAAAVARLSDGALRIRVLGEWRGTGTRSEIDYERGIVSDVRTNKAQLGIVGVRVWDTLGVTSFQALVAPFLIDSLALERRALETPFAGRALASVREAGVVGVALLPGRLRRPFGLTRPLVQVQDYRGARIAIRPSRMQEETFRALGARSAGYIPGDLAGFDGTDLDPLTITRESFDPEARALTANVVLWPKPWTIVMNTAAFARLSKEQQQLLFTAGHDALAPDLAQVSRDQQLGLATICRFNTLPLPMATAADLAALRNAVQPVYDRIERDPFSRKWLAQITRMRASAAPDVARCP